MEQSKLGSFYEACLNVAIGYSVATVANYYILPHYPVITWTTSAIIGLWFTIISLARSYVVRRWFNARLHRLAYEMADQRDD